MQPCRLRTVEYFMSAAADTTNNKNVLTQKKGNHKGCPYNGLAGGYFLWNRSCSLVVCTPRDENGSRFFRRRLS